MTTPVVLASKLSPPRITKWIARPRVTATVRDAMETPITWILARPGAGKSVALTQLAAQTKAVVWARLDESDADVSAFFRTLAAAVRKTWPRRKLHLPTVRPGHLASIETFAARFAEAAFGTCRTPPVMVLDDYHRLGPDSQVHQALVALATALDGAGHILVASRTPPPPAFARMQVSESLTLLGVDVLDFTPDETARLCRARGSAEPTAVFGATQGWATGVALLARGGETTGSPHLVFDYFASQVFDHLDARSQKVLLDTAYLPTLEPTLAAKLTDQDPAPVFRLLAREALFTRRQRAAGCFHHHDLFRDFLQARVEAEAPDDGKSRILATARVLTGIDPATAGALLIRAEAWEDLRMLVMSQGFAMAQTGRFTTLSGWVAALPPKVVEEQPWVSYWLGVAKLETRPLEACRALQTALDTFANNDDAMGYSLAFSLLVTAVTAERNDVAPLDEPLQDLFRRLEDGWPTLDPFVEANLASGVAIALSFRDPSHPQLRHWQDRAYSLVAHLPLPEPKAIALGRMTLSMIWSGDFERAAAALDPLRKLVDDDEQSPFLAGLLYLTITYLAFYTAPKDCRYWRDRGLAAERTSNSNMWSRNLRCHDCAALLSLGRLDEAEVELDSVRRDMLDATRLERIYYAELRSWLALSQGRPMSAIRYAEQGYEHSLAYGAHLPRWSTQYATAMAHITLGNAEDARVLLNVLERDASCMPFFLYMVAFARGRIALLAGDESAALEQITLGLDISAELGCVNFFYWCNDHLAPLLLLALRHGIQPSCVRETIRQHAIRVDVPPDLVFMWPWEVEVHVLGPLQATVDGRDPVPITGKRAALLSELIATRNGVLQSTLCDVLWPDADGDNAVRSLHTTLHRLRKILGHNAIVHDGTRVRLDSQRCLVDAWVLQDLATRPTALDGMRQAMRARMRGEVLENVRVSWATREWQQNLERTAQKLLGPPTDA